MATLASSRLETAFASISVRRGPQKLRQELQVASRLLYLPYSDAKLLGLFRPLEDSLGAFLKIAYLVEKVISLSDLLGLFSHDRRNGKMLVAVAHQVRLRNRPAVRYEP